MEKKQISGEVEDISTEVTLEKEQKVPSLSYIKSYSETQFKMTTFDYRWKIKHFRRFYDVKDTLLSPPFAEKGQYKIEMYKCKVKDKEQFIRFYIRTNEEFTGICTTTLLDDKSLTVSSKSISGRITDMKLLIEMSIGTLFSSYRIDNLTIHCQLEVLRDLVNNSIRMNLLPSSTVTSEDVKSKDSTLEFESKNEESIKFILEHEEHYIVSKKLLYAINSSYFKNICLTHKGKEKDMRNELKDDELNIFKYILLFILTGLINQHPWYISFEQLLRAADKYDVPTLKLRCEHCLLRGITIENALKFIQFAFSANAKFLETHSAAFIKFHKKEIMGTKEFQDLPPEDINKILELIE